MSTRCQVRELRLRAPDAASVQRAAALTADALKTATLPGDQSARVVFIRRLDIGRIDLRASSATLALQVERAARAAMVAAVAADDPRAGTAPAVHLPDRITALKQLARRLARRQATPEWFWSRLVPGWPGSGSPSEAWRSLWRQAALESPPALALSAVAAAAFEGNEGAWVASLLPAQQIPVWWQLCGWQNEPVQPAPAAPRQLAPPVLRAVRLVLGATVGTPLSGPGFQFLCRLLTLSLAPTLASNSVWRLIAGPLRSIHEAELSERTNTVSGPRSTGNDLAAGDLLATPAPPDFLQPKTLAPTLREPWLAKAPHYSAVAAETKPGPPVTSPRPPPWPQEAKSMEDPDPRNSPGRSPGADSTRFGGLFFLVAPLHRLGCSFSLDDSSVANGWGALLLRSIGQALGMKRDDPLGTLLEASSAFDTEPSPAGFAGDAAARALSKPAAALLARSPLRVVPQSPVELWRILLRRWLRTQVGCGLHQLVVRPAYLTATPTHLDLYFSLDQIDIRIRRAGLDLDPGWVPWLGRVLTFHYSGSPGSA